MGIAPAIYITGDTVYHADKCEPLSSAAARGELELHMWSRGAYPGHRLPEKSLIEICSIGVWDAERPQAWGLPCHRNEGIEITYLEQGSLDFAVDGKECRLGPGSLTVTRPWQEHRVGLPNVTGSRLYWLILDVGTRHPHSPWHWPDWLVLAPEELRLLTDCLRGNEQPVWCAGPGLGQCFRKWYGTLREGREGPLESRLKVQINEMFLSLAEMLRGAKGPVDPDLSSAERTVAFFLKELPKHLDHEWDMPEMARHCGMGRSQFALHFRRIANRSPMAYLADCRVEAARRLLRETRLTVTEIAERCGFRTSQYFATQFRVRTGLAPAAFRKEEWSRGPVAG